MELFDIPDFENYKITKCGKVYSLISKRFISIHTTNKGYYGVRLWKDKEQYHVSIHRLIALVFIGNPEKHDYVVNHKNGIKTDNRVENLEWCSFRDNSIHYFLYLKKFGKFSKKNEMSAVGLSNDYVPSRTSVDYNCRLLSREEYGVIYDLCEKKIPVRFIVRKFKNIGEGHIKRVYNFINGKKRHLREV